MSARRTERLLNLLFALMAASQPVTRVQLRNLVTDYHDESDEAFERMFERDKDELRGMGVPIDTVHGAGGESLGYRVRRDDYALPEIQLTPAELSVLGLAARVWEQASLGPAARSALAKLEAAGGGWADNRPVGVQTRVTAHDPALLPLLDAVRVRRPVRFDYRRPDQQEPSIRRVEPWGVLSRRGRWYVVGRDLDRDQPRAFRLSRIEGIVRRDGSPDSYTVPADVDVRALVAPPVSADRTARVRLAPGRGQELRRRALRVEPGPHAAAGGPTSADLGDDIVTVVFGEARTLAAEAAALGADAVVLEPRDVRDAVRALLAGALMEHAR